MYQYKNSFAQVFTFTYCISSEALLYPFNPDGMGSTVFRAFKRAYLNVFGDINVDGMDAKLLQGESSSSSE